MKTANLEFMIQNGQESMNVMQIADAFSEAAYLCSVAPDLLEALQCLMKEYKQISDSGDCGFWKAEEQAEYILAEKTLKKALS